MLADTHVDADAVRQALPSMQDPDNSLAAGIETSEATGPLAQRVLAFDRAAVMAELERHQRNITRTAKALGLERSHLYKKGQQLGIDLRNLPEQA